MAANGSDARHRIGAVVRLSGVSAHALRAWERRYGALEPRRTEGGDRLYSDADIRRLRLLKQLTEYGHAISDVARLDQRALERLLMEHTRPAEVRADARASASASVERCLDALAALDVDTAGRIVRRAAATRAPRDFVDQVAHPLLEAMGRRWQAGELCVASEHAGSALLRTELGRLLAELPAEPRAPVVVCTTLSGERHELGALFAAVMAALSGWRPLYFGPDLPAREIADAVRTTGAALLLLSIVSLSARKARDELERLTRALPDHAAVIVGGRAAAETARRVAGVELVSDWSALASRLVVRR